MPKRKKLTDADVKKVESVILSDTDVEKADQEVSPTRKHLKSNMDRFIV